MKNREKQIASRLERRGGVNDDGLSSVCVECPKVDGMSLDSSGLEDSRR